MLLHSPPHPRSLQQLATGCGLLPELGHGTSQTEAASAGLRAIPLEVEAGKGTALNQEQSAFSAVGGWAHCPRGGVRHTS